MQRKEVYKELAKSKKTIFESECKQNCTRTVQAIRNEADSFKIRERSRSDSRERRILCFKINAATCACKEQNDFDTSGAQENQIEE